MPGVGGSCWGGGEEGRHGDAGGGGVADCAAGEVPLDTGGDGGEGGGAGEEVGFH